MSRLTILIPWWNEHAAFEETLVSVLEHRPAGSEVLVTHSHPYDDPYHVRGEVGLIQVPTAEHELDLINTGFYRATGDVVHVVRCGLRATPDWTESAVPHFDDPDIALVAIAAGDEATSCGVGGAHGGPRLDPRQHDARRVVGASLDGGFFRRQAVLDVDGFEAQLAMGHTELDLALTLRQLQQRCICEPRSQLWGQIPAIGDLKHAAASAECLFWRHPHTWWNVAAHAAQLLAEQCGQLGKRQAWRVTRGRVSRLQATGPLCDRLATARARRSERERETSLPRAA